MYRVIVALISVKNIFFMQKKTKSQNFLSEIRNSFVLKYLIGKMINFAD